jgi:hypothetical protein
MAHATRMAATVCLSLGTLLCWADPLQADDCGRLGGSLVDGECQVSSPVAKSGTFNLNENLHVLGAGRITVPATWHGASLVLNVQGDLLMDMPTVDGGGAITGDAADARGTGATIEVHATRDIVLQDGARITARQTATVCAGGEAGSVLLNAGRNLVLADGSLVSAGGGGCAAGEIALLAPEGTVEIAGTVSSESAQDDPRKPAGGPITVMAGCKVIVLETAVVSSRGGSAPADLVHLSGGCDVVVLGLVESSGSGSLDAGNGRKYRHVRPAHDTRGVEVWAGHDLTIDRNGGANGQVAADNGSLEKGSDAQWIELIAGGDLTINGRGQGPFAVHANTLGGRNGNGGQVLMLSRGGKVTASGLAVQADSTRSDGSGGMVRIEAAKDVSLVSASVFARGDSAGRSAEGGQVAIRSFNGTVTWTDPADVGATGDVGPTGDGVDPQQAGSITLMDCTAGPIDLSGVSFPFVGSAATTPVLLAEACGGSPELPGYVDLPACDPGRCGSAALNDFCFLASLRNELDPQGIRFPDNGGPDVVVDLAQGESIQAALDFAIDVNGDGYIIVGVVGRSGGLPGGSATQNLSVNRAYTLPFGLVGCGVTLHDPRPSDQYPTAKVMASASAPADGRGSRIFITGISVEGSNIAGWWVAGDGRSLRDVNASGNLIGVEISGNHNLLRGGALTENAGVAIQVEGDGNLVTGVGVFLNQGMGALVAGNSNIFQRSRIGDLDLGNGDLGLVVTGQGNRVEQNEVFANFGDGINVEGDGNTVRLNSLGAAGKGNAGDGLHLFGAGNVVEENQALANRGDGFEIRGGTAASPNVIRKNRAGAAGTGNGLHGFFLDGTGNGSSAPVEIDENTATQNLGAGFKVGGTGQQLRKNICEQNVGCDFDVEPGNVNATGNTIDGVSVSGANGTAFPAGCMDVAH